MMEQLPPGWAWATMADIAQWGSGGTPRKSESQYYGGKIPWAVIGDLNDGIVRSCKDRITSKGLSESNCKLVQPGTVLLAMYGASIGRLGIAGMTMATNQAIAFAVPSINRWYLFYYLLSQRPLLITAGQGAAQKNISQTILKAWSIPVPPIAEQRRIVERIEEVFSRLDSIESTLTSLLMKLDLLRSSILADAFHTNRELPNDWERMTVGELCKVEYGKGLSKKKRVETGPVEVYGSAGLAGHHDRALVQERVIIVGRKGNAGRVWLTNGPSWPIDTTYFLRPRQEFSIDFVALQLANLNLMQMDSSTTIPSLRRPDLEATSLAMAPPREQKRRVAMTEGWLSRIHPIEASLKRGLEQLAVLSESVLAVACGGRLVPQDQNEEPASALLKRIAESRPATTAR